ncbi:hypothetical protein SNE40_003237 [Patella caerulea]|uniref:Uncharacterized protein n=1 Tax=Patella caerulea TaxID=87958 RepID=A0AAN8K7K7_PATCE
MLVVSSSAAKGAFDETACVICNSAGKTLTGTNGGRVKIRIAVEQLQDSLAASRINAYSNTFMYHLKPKCCYSTYILNSEVEICPKKSEPELFEEVEEGESSDSYNVAKRRKKSSSSSYIDIERKCVICDRVRESCGDRGRVLYRISESDRAASFLDALNFYKDEVETRCAFFG